MRFLKSVFIPLFSLVISIAAHASTEVTRTDCNGLSVKISNYRDAEMLFSLLPATSESWGDSALWRSVEFRTQHDGIRLACALSSGYQGVCSVVYSRDSATTDSCDFVPTDYPLSSPLSEQLVRILGTPGATYRTRDQILTVQCESSGLESHNCWIKLRR